MVYNPNKLSTHQLEALGQIGLSGLHYRLMHCPIRWPVLMGLRNRKLIRCLSTFEEGGKLVLSPKGKRILKREGEKL